MARAKVVWQLARRGHSMPTHRSRFVPLLRRAALASLIVLCSLGTTGVRSQAGDLEQFRPHEVIQTPIVRPSPFVHSTSPAATVSFGGFTSVQVNVDLTGANIPGAAATAPSHAV